MLKFGTSDANPELLSLSLESNNMNRSRERDESTSSSGNVSVSSTGGSRKKNKNTSSKPPNPVTVEKVRLIMEQEGRSARNLVSWSIPLDTHAKTRGKHNKSSSKMQNQSKRAQSCESALRKGINNSKDSYKPVRSSSGERKGKKALGSDNLVRRSGPGKKPVSIRARYWAYLFENLRRAVDEIYTTCDADANVMECKEVLLVLDNYRHEFQALIDWINLQERLENADVHNRPTSLAWEVRKSSPGRPRHKTAPKAPEPPTIVQHRPPGSEAKINRLLNFSKASDVASLSAASAGVAAALCLPSDVVPQEGPQPTRVAMEHTVTWADRVKGIAPPPKPEVKAPLVSPSDAENRDAKKPLHPTVDVQVVDDEGGWETVTSQKRAPKHHNHSGNKVLQNIANTAPTLTPKRPPVKVRAVKSPLPSAGLANHVTGHVIAAVKTNHVNGHVAEDQHKASTPKDEAAVTNAVEFMGMCEAGEGEGDAGGKLTFEGDPTDPNDVRLQELDAAEVEFFQSVQEEDNHVNSEGVNTPHNAASQMDKGDSVSLEQLRTLEQHDASIAAAEEQERDLRRQILEVQEEKTEGRDTPDPETDCESARSSMGAKEISRMEKPTTANGGPLEWTEFLARFDNPAEQPSQSWCDLVEEEELREPGRAGQMHEKLSSPSRKSRNSAESKRRLEEKHRKAEARRLRMQEEKTQRIHELFQKVQVVVSWKNDLIQRQKMLLQGYHAEKLAKAEEQRAMQLLSIKRKAQAEDTKVSEIAFINELQEQNKRHEVLMRMGEMEARFQEKEVEKLKMLEIKSAKEEHFKERRRALEKERRERIEELKVKRAEQDARIEQQRIEKEKEREKMAKERARDRELRLSARYAAQQEAVTELQKKIQLKHDESERRHQEQLEHRKEKAVELSMGRFTASSPATVQGGTGFPQGLEENATNNNSPALEDKNNNPIGIDFNAASAETRHDTCEHSSASRGSANTSPRSANDECKALKEELARMKERKKTMRKRAKKIRVRMATRGKEFLKRMELKNQTPNGASKSKILRLVKEANRQLANQSDHSGPWPANRVTALDRTLGEMVRILEKSTEQEKIAFRCGGGFDLVEAVFQVPIHEDSSPEIPPILPDRLLGNAAFCFRLACAGFHDNCVYAVYSNRLTTLVDALLLLIARNVIDGVAKEKTVGAGQAKKGGPTGGAGGVRDHFDAASPALLSALAVALSLMAGNPPKKDATSPKASTSFTHMVPLPNNEHRKVLEVYLNRGLDVISYIVASGVLDLLGEYLSSVRHEVSPGSNLAAFVQHGLAFLEAATSFVTMRNRLSPSNHASKQQQASQSGAAAPNTTTPWDTDPTQLLPTLQHTELMGIVSVLYGLLLHGAPERPTAMGEDQTTPLAPGERIPEHTLSVALAVMRVLNAVAEMDLRLLQASLGAEGVSLEYRHICTYLLWYCVQGDYTKLLHEVIVSVGHFTLDNQSNQNIVVSGAQPTVLQQLCLLPFSYFSNPLRTRILHPTLISCCHGNTSNLAIMEEEASSSHLVSYIKVAIAGSGDKEGPKSKQTTEKINGVIQVEKCSLHGHPLFTKEYLTRALAFFSDAGEKL